MKVLVLGATGATGSLVVKQLLNNNVEVKAVIRKHNSVLKDLENNELLTCVCGNISEFDLNRNVELINDCDAVICCLGHNLSFKGLFGRPRMLVSDSVKNICKAIANKKKEKMKIVLMNTTGNMNRNIKENYSLGDRIVLSLLTVILPPQRDNVKAAKYLTKQLLENNTRIEWIAVRPDTLINEENVSGYEILESPGRSPVFNPGRTSRINAAHFMVDLLLNAELWDSWKYKMPVIYNRN